ncbi:MAG: 5'-nucleotidase, lipoprotein e(P4) family [Bacteroidales bacterium]|nr:5'-nucleotidase, lipoprotein e(P4) family [Bacteroidales bacterium]
MKKFILLSIMFFSIVSCQNTTDETNTSTKKDPTNEHLLMSTVWFQNSAEMRAIYYQSYNLAKMIVNNSVSKLDKNEKKAVVLDIDETVLDNSPFQVKCIKTGQSYSTKTWKEWTSLSQAKALPGAVDFTNYAKNKGVEVFYISNRLEEELGVTMKNMKELNFPCVDSAHFLLKTTESGKKIRRVVVKKDYNIILFIGDNLTDYSEIYEKRDENFAIDIVDKNKGDFGTKFIILPNPMYGEWEKAIYDNTYKLSKEVKNKKLKNCLLGY